ncbi:MarR family winged helix-turn-helix transcriptional regulator [Rhodococcus pyridinivorans]|uniref:MarR family winged helix-turn-helix transcriptional regulator n=1 Tax=Rhodococcus pyridinivorans TaxID=103816 RepID=UPI0039B37D2D
MKQTADDLEAMIGYRLKQAQSALRARTDEALRPLGLTTPQYSCLEAIERNPGASNSEIARGVFVTRQTMSTLFRGLQQRGLVDRAESAEAGRAIPTALTDEGRRLLVEASERVGRINQAITDALGPELTAALALGLSRCIETLESGPSYFTD